MSKMSPVDIQFVFQFLYQESGIALGPEKDYLVENRLSELARELGHPVPELLRLIRQGQCRHTSRRVVEAMTTNETSFFRDLTPFEALRTTLLPELLEQRKQTRTLRIWSAACSTGQEAYSIAMVLDANYGSQLADWKVEILGTDLADKVLQRASKAEYNQVEVNRGLPAQNLIRYFKRKGSSWTVCDSLKRWVRFQQANLLNIPANLGQFDVIFCRNVLIYFDLATKGRVLESMCRHLQPHGALFLGGSETILGVTSRLERCSLGGAVCYKLGGSGAESASRRSMPMTAAPTQKCVGI